MIDVPVSIRPARQAAVSVDGFVIWSPDPQCWLEEMSRWKIPLKDVRLFILPRSRFDLTAAGALVILTKRAAPSAVSRALPYRCIAGVLYVPAHSAIFPPMADDEVRARFLNEISVLTPTGLVGFAKQNALTIASLLAPPNIGPADFNQAVAGIPPAMRLTEILPLTPPTPVSILEEGRDDIGTEPLRDIPKSPDESVAGAAIKSAAAAPLLLLGLPFGLLSRVFSKSGEPAQEGPGKQKKRSFMQKFFDLLRRKPKDGGKPPSMHKSPKEPPLYPQAPGQSRLANTISSLRNILAAGGASNRLLAATLGQLSAALEARRNREIHRLMKMLQDSPDEGLRHAIPFTGGDSRRGTASPSAALGTRNVDFSLAGLNYSGPGDSWTLREDHRIMLQKRYRELANRELHLARFRRAAYIFAHLLGDFSAAAAALKQGRHYREAAVIYREKLFNVPAAAECLEEAGLLLEAIPLYEELKKFEKVGDLYTKLERPEEAASAYELEVARLLENSDSLAAAALAENKLGNVDRALLILDAAWPSRRQAAECVRTSFKIRARLGQHDQSAGRIAQITAETSHDPVTLAAIIAEQALNYPDAAVRMLCDDAARVTVGRYLCKGASQNQALVRSLTALSPGDKTLARDGRRYLRIEEPLPGVPQRTPDRGKAPQEVREFMLGADGMTCLAAAAMSDGLIAVSNANGHPIFLAADWLGGGRKTFSTDVVISLMKPNPTIELTPVLKAGPPTHCICWDVSGRTFVDGAMLTTSSGPGIELVKPWGVIPERCIALCHESPGLIWSIEDVDTLTLLAWDAPSNIVRSSHSLDLWLGAAIRELAERPAYLPMVAHQGHIFIGVGGQVAHIRNMTSMKFIDMPGKVRKLVPLESMGRFRVVALCENGIRLIFWPDAECVAVSPAIPDAVAGFTRAGALVVVSGKGGEGHVYVTQGAKITSRIEFKTPAARAVLPTNAQNEFAIVSTEGNVIIYKLPG